VGGKRANLSTVAGKRQLNGQPGSSLPPHTQEFHDDEARGLFGERGISLHAGVRVGGVRRVLLRGRLKAKMLFEGVL
jgi:hypothetical protein